MKSAVYFVLAVLIILTSAMPTIAAPNNAASTFSCTDVTEIPQAECEALVALYNSTDGPGWTNSTNWLVTNTPGNWHGVTVESGHVTILNLGYNQLSGSISSELGNLINLTELNLSDNQLVGNIPPVLGNLNNLTLLNLEYNQLSGSIPPELGNLTKLNRLYLSKNSFIGGIPSELGNQTSLQKLELYSNQLNGSIPPELGNLTNLTYLLLSDNELSGSIPIEVGNLLALNILDFSNNKLTGSIPTELSELTSLVDLGLDGNQLSGNIPSELGGLVNLISMNLSSNQLNGSIPGALGDLVSLNILRLNDNNLVGDVPDTFINLINLFDPGMVWDGGDGLDLDYNLLYIPPGYPNPTVPLQVFLNQKDPDWQLYQGFTQVIGAGGGELTSLDRRTDFLIPAGALITDTTFTFIPLPAPTHDSGTLAFAHISFLLTAVDAGGNPIITFDQPITATITYTDSDIVAPENTLGLYYWDTAASIWTDAVTTCPEGVYTRNPAANDFSLPLCHLTEFGVFGTPLRIFMPLVHR